MEKEGIKNLGYELVEEYEHGKYRIERYSKGRTDCEMTYLKSNGLFHSFDLKIRSVYKHNIELSFLEKIDKLING